MMSADMGGITPAITGQVAYTTPGTYFWTCPAGVTSVSVVCVGSGGAGRTTGASGYNGNTSYFGTGAPSAGGGGGLSTGSTNVGGSVLAGSGGAGGFGTQFGCGGAGGYAGSGGGGAATATSNGLPGAGGGAGGGAAYTAVGGWGTPGGGVGLLGQGTSGAGGVYVEGNSTGGLGGSGGVDGGNTSPPNLAFGAGSISFKSATQPSGGGGALAYANNIPVTPGNAYIVVVGLAVGDYPSGSGAVRIIWPGNTRFFPSTNTGDM